MLLTIAYVPKKLTRATFKASFSGNDCRVVPVWCRLFLVVLAGSGVSRGCSRVLAACSGFFLLVTSFANDFTTVKKVIIRQMGIIRTLNRPTVIRKLKLLKCWWSKKKEFVKRSLRLLS